VWSFSPAPPSSGTAGWPVRVVAVGQPTRVGSQRPLSTRSAARQRFLRPVTAVGSGGVGDRLPLGGDSRCSVDARGLAPAGAPTPAARGRCRAPLRWGGRIRHLLPTVVELTVLRALTPAGDRSAEALRLTSPYGVPALVQLLEGLARGGYVEAVSPHTDVTAKTAYVLTDEGLAEVPPGPST
jgi:hypothetical protein